MDMASQEKHHQHSTSDPDSPVSPIKSNISNIHDRHAPQAWSSMPKRKPLPVPATTTDDAESPANETGNKANSFRIGATFASLFSLNWYRYASKRQMRRFLIVAAAIAVVLLLALIIGLSVGLTVGKKNSDSSNLALPTSHGGPYKGDLTYYNPALGSCGDTNSDSDLICAVSHVLFDAASTGSNPNENPLCGLKLRLRRDGQSVDVKVVDRCVGCKETDLDVTETVFKKVADINQGRVPMEWSWLEQPPVSIS